MTILKWPHTVVNRFNEFRDKQTYLVVVNLIGKEVVGGSKEI